MSISLYCTIKCMKIIFFQEGKKVKSSSGFSGKGFKFDETEAQLANEKKKFQKAALGLQDSDDEDVEADIDKEIETLLAPKKRVQEITILPSGATGLPSNIASAEKLELAKKVASRISLQRNIGAEAQQAAEAVLKGHLGTPVISVSFCIIFFLLNLFVILTICNYQITHLENLLKNLVLEFFKY